VEHSNLLSRGRVPPQDTIGVDEFHRFFEDKVEAVRASTAGAPAPAFSMTAALLPAFQMVSIENVINAIRQLPDKSCTSDPVPILLPKAVSCYVGRF
jgi:hypothetical protein